jgi:hypothetical protein
VGGVLKEVGRFFSTCLQTLAALLSFFLVRKEIGVHIRGSAKKAINIARSEEHKAKQELCQCESRAKIVQFKTLKSFPKSPVNILSPSLVLRNCWVWRMGPPGVAGLLAQHGHVPFGSREGRARCTTSRRLEARKRKNRGISMHVTICGNKVRQRSATDTFASATDTMPNTCGFFLHYYSAMELSGAGF